MDALTKNGASIVVLIHAEAPESRRVLRADQPEKARVDTPLEVDYLRNGGVLNYVLRNFMQKA